MSTSPVWLRSLLAPLVAAAPDLLTAAATDAPLVVADALSSAVPGCDACAVVFPVLRSGGRRDRPFATRTATDPGLLAVLDVEAEERSGPVRDVGRGVVREPVHLPDVAADPRWPGFGRRVTAASPGVRALSVIPVHVASRGVLVLAGGRPHAFDDVRADLAAVVAPVELFLRLAWAEVRAHAARDGLQTGQLVGTAVGVVMATDAVTAEAALGTLRAAAQRTGRPLRQVAADVIAGDHAGYLR